MKITLLFVPPGGGETDYGLDFESPGVPQPGDYICIKDSDEPGRQKNFIVRRSWWYFKSEKNQELGSTEGVTVECEFALSPFSSESHKSACELHSQKRKVTEFDDSCY